MLCIVFTLLCLHFVCRACVTLCAGHWPGLWCKAAVGLSGHALLRPSHDTCYRLYDVLELGVERYQGIKDFAQAAKLVQLGNKVTSCELQAAVLHS